MKYWIIEGEQAPAGSVEKKTSLIGIPHLRRTIDIMRNDCRVSFTCWLAIVVSNGESVRGLSSTGYERTQRVTTALAKTSMVLKLKVSRGQRLSKRMCSRLYPSVRIRISLRNGVRNVTRMSTSWVGATSSGLPRAFEHWKLDVCTLGAEPSYTFSRTEAAPCVSNKREYWYEND